MAVSSTPARPDGPDGPARPAPRPRVPAARASGRSATASRSTPTSGSRRTTTRSTSGPGSRTSTPTAASPRIDPQDLRGRFRWWGLYTQRKARHRRRPHRRAGAARAGRRVLHAPGPDRRRPAQPGPAARHRRHLHASSPGTPPTSPTGRTSSCTGSGSRTCRRSGGGWRRSACRPPRPAATAPRVVLGSPVAGVGRDEVLDPTPAIDEIVAPVRRRPGVLQPAAQVQDRRSPGWPTPRTRPTTSRSSASMHPEHGPGFDLWVGGGLSTNPMLAQRLGVWVPLDEVPDVWAGVVGIFRDYGYRRLRNRARLKFLVADWGVEKFREVLEKEYLRPRPARRSGAGAAGASRSTTSACTSSGTAGTTSGAAPVVGRVSGTQLAAAGRRRRGARQRPGAAHPVPEAAGARRRRRAGSNRWSTALRGIGLEARPSAWRRGTMACTGIEYCKLAIVETKARGAELVARLEERLRDFDARHLHPHQRLPERLRPHPGRRHRPQGPAGASAPDGAAGRGLPGAPRRRAGHGPGPDRRLRPQAARPQDHRRRSFPSTSSGWPAATWPAATEGETFAHWVDPGRRGGAAMSETPEPRRCYCPYCGEEDLRPTRRARRLGVPRLRPGLLGEVHGLLARR